MNGMSGNSGNISEVVYSQLLDMITNGQYKPNDKIPSENELKEILNASRGTIRTALSKLRALGILETRHGGGSFVRAIDSNVYMHMMIPSILWEKNSLSDIIWLRKAIEVQAAYCAAVNATESDAKQLLLLSKKTKNEAYNAEKQWNMNTTLHMRIVRASHNQLFITMEELIQNLLTYKMKTFLINQGEDIDSDFYHRNIIECIVNRKPEEASFLMDKHDSLVIERVNLFEERENDG